MLMALCERVCVCMCVYVCSSLQFTFASNAATIVGGCLVTNQYKLRLPAAFISAFVISVSSSLQQLCRDDNYKG